MSVIKKIFFRLFVYLAEFAFCLRAGDALRDKLVLLHETAWFHARHNRPGQTLLARIKIRSLRPLLKMRRYGGDTFIFHEVLRCGVYEFPEDLLRDEARVIVDLGANIGITALSLAARFPQARLVCVEPLPENADLLKHNMRCLETRAVVIEAAVSDRSGFIDLAIAEEHYNASLVRSSGKVLRVQAVTMDEIMNQTGITSIDVLKMDIEGAELMILEGRPRWLDRVKVLLAELHGPRQDEMCRWITEAGFQMKRDGCQITAWRI
jgi:FkbM family methyltransferase